jgi:DNA transformation protein
MPAPIPDHVVHALELLGPLGPTRARRMFGGFGLYADDVFVALVFGEQLYLKADDTTRPTFEAAGCQPFVYEAAGQPVSIGYWSAPDDAMESPALMLPWARLAFAAALRARGKKPKR